MALIPLNTFKTKTAVLTTLKYNQAKCSRDTGLMVDSIAFDLLFGGTTQSVFAATQYWSQGETKIPGEVFQTLSALQHAKEVAKKLVANVVIIKSIGNNVSQVTNLAAGSATARDIIDSEFELIMDIIENGTTGTTDKIESNTGTVTDTSFDMTSDSGIANAAAILQANKAFLQAEVVAFVNNRFNAGYVYDQTKCARDTGLIVDSLANDLLFSGTTQSTYAGLQYWTQNGSTVPNETTQTEAALVHAQSVISNIVTNQTVSASVGNKLAQVINQSLLTGTAAQATVAQLMTNIINIIHSGTTNVTIDGIAGRNVTNAIVPNGELSTDETILNAVSLLQSNKKFIKSEVVTWINNQKASNSAPFTTAFTYDSDKCSRDVGYIIDCISFDLQYGGNRQSLQAGSYYYGFTNISSISSGVVITAGAFEIGSAYVIINPGNTVFTNIGADNNASGTMFVASGAGSGSGTAYKADETSESISAYNYMKSLISDIIEGQPITEIYQSIVPQFIDVFNGTETESNIVKDNIDLITNIILNGPSVAPSPQPISLTASLDQTVQNAAAILLANKEFIKAEVIAYINKTTQSKIVKSGYFKVGNVYTIETLGNSTDFTAIGASSNTIGLAFTATGTGDPAKTGTATAGFTYTNSNIYDNTNKCYRDVGYIVDCITFDLRFPGNRQAIQAGVYYFNNSSASSVVAAEKTDTINAYNYMSIVMSSVIKNLPLTQLYVKQQPNGTNYLKAPYQSDVPQITSLKTPTTGLTTVVNNVASLISGTMVPIITNGPSSVIPRVPIGLTPSSDVDKIRAYDILMTNKEYIVSEVIGYMNELTSPNTTKIYTAPPGVTAIVLMAQVSNVTDHDISITFAHYRNLPVFADPATLNGYQAPNTVTEIVKEYLIPPNDAASLIQGKMIIESFDSIVAYASESHGLKVTLSILETANA